MLAPGVSGGYKVLKDYDAHCKFHLNSPLLLWLLLLRPCAGESIRVETVSVKEARNQNPPKALKPGGFSTFEQRQYL
jgi:hypothetical protein